ncbi:MAG: Hsp70 family protein [Chloroflexales bacterium]|nr:Hsp70 family protein [Chloroflexales bacterium]
MSAIIGIDLGTTFSATAFVREGTPHIIAHGDERIMPSMAGLTPQGNLLVGTPARNQYVLYPDRTVRSIKRKMGQSILTKLGDREYAPQEISALILRELKRRAEAEIGEPIERAVITVPAYFSDAARQATREAGEIAGFTVERIINEPTAAALAYGLDRSDERQLVAVYDLGGGTFDISIIELDAGVVEVRASHGNTQLGGDDFDQRLADLLAERFMQQYERDPRTDRRALARLMRAAEIAKIALSEQPFTRVREEYLLTEDGQPMHIDIELSRAEFEDLISDLLEGTLQSFEAALNDAGMSINELDRVLFVGGSTRIPLIWQMVRDFTGLEPEIAVNPDEAVALGAAAQAAIIAGEPLDAILVDVTPHSLGIEVAEWQFGQLVPDRYNVIIHRNTTIPTSRSEVYSAIHPTQTAIEIKVYQGEHPIASRNSLLGEFMFDQLRPEVSGEPPRITVQFDFDINGILHVSATDRGSGKEARISVKAARAQLSPAEIDSARADLEALEEDLFASAFLELGDDELIIDQDALSAAQPKSRAEPSLEVAGLLARARRAVERESGDIAALETAIAALEAAVQSGDKGVIEERAEELLDLLYELDEE